MATNAQPIDAIACQNCGFFQTRQLREAPEKITGVCLRHAPIAVLRENAPARADTRWPFVYGDQWCGDFAVPETVEDMLLHPAEGPDHG